MKKIIALLVFLLFLIGAGCNMKSKAHAPLPKNNNELQPPDDDNDDGDDDDGPRKASRQRGIPV